MARIVEESRVDWTAAGELFADRTARDALVAESLAPRVAQGGLSLADLKASALAGGRMPGASGVVPFAALKLFRSLLSRRALGYSAMARAASTSGEINRQVGDFNLDVVADSDAIFLVIAPVADKVPTSITLLGEDGRIATIELPEPIGESIQIGLVDDGGALGMARQLINDPLTSIFIQ
ncbi:MAG: hypothetical protein GC150_02755 [Rhizobiales bacterium]|nr:hypothetical protein [Hyphomicrobiales bacterium]